MPGNTIDISVASERPERRDLLARFCTELGRALAGNEVWDGGGSVVPWHVSASEFDALPARLAETIFAEWDESGGQLAGIEFSGYLETDQGPRAWGSLMVRDDLPRGRIPELLSCTVGRAGDGYRLNARLRTGDADNA